MIERVVSFATARKKRWLLVLVTVAAVALPFIGRQGRFQKRKVTGMLAAVCPARPRRRFPVMRPSRPNPSRGLGDDDQAVVDAIRRISRVTRLAGQDARKRAGLTSAQLAVLRCLDSAQSLSLNELAQRTLTNPSSVSEVVARLVGQGLVLRNRSARDARSVELSLSPPGRAALGAVAGVDDDGLRAGLQKMHARERRHLSKLLIRLLDKVNGRQQPIEPAEPVELAQTVQTQLSDLPA